MELVCTNQRMPRLPSHCCSRYAKGNACSHIAKRADWEKSRAIKSSGKPLQALMGSPSCIPILLGLQSPTSGRKIERKPNKRIGTGVSRRHLVCSHIAVLWCLSVWLLLVRNYSLSVHLYILRSLNDNPQPPIGRRT